MKSTNYVGRPATDGARNLQQKTIMLDKQSITVLRKLGKGNLSAGVRAAARLVAGTA